MATTGGESGGDSDGGVAAMDVVEPQLSAVGACRTGRARRRCHRRPLGAAMAMAMAMAIMARDACCVRGVPLLVLGAVDFVGGRHREGRGSVGLTLVGGDEKLAIVTSLMSPYMFLRLHHRSSVHSLVLSPRLFLISGLSLSRMLNVFFASFPSPLTHFQRTV